MEVPDELAEQIIDSIDQSIADGDDVWTFQGDFGIEQAAQVRNGLEEQL